MVPKIANLICDQIASHPNGRVGVYGDSAGGGLALSAIQYLVADNKPVPASLVLVSPFLDVTMSNPAIASIDDPVLNAAALRESRLEWAGRLDPKDPLVSPLYGSLERLPPTYVYSGSLDVLYPDVLVLQEHARQQGAPMTLDLRKGRIHNWAMLPVTLDGRAVLPGILAQLSICADQCADLLPREELLVLAVALYAVAPPVGERPERHPARPTQPAKRGAHLRPRRAACDRGRLRRRAVPAPAHRTAVAAPAASL